jgi:hypothetical protein
MNRERSADGTPVIFLSTLHVGVSRACCIHVFLDLAPSIKCWREGLVRTSQLCAEHLAS